MMLTIGNQMSLVFDKGWENRPVSDLLFTASQFKGLEECDDLVALSRPTLVALAVVAARQEGSIA